MKIRLRNLLGMACLMIGTLAAAAVAPAAAQSPPAITEELVPYSERGTTVPGPDFELYFTDQKGNRITRVEKEKGVDYTVTLVITTPIGFANDRIWCVLYNPPDRQVRNWLLPGADFRNTAGTFTIASYSIPGYAPYGEYVFRVGLSSRDNPFGGTLFWREKMVIIPVEQPAPPVIVPITINSFTVNNSSTGTINKGETATLAWSVSGATTIAIDQGVNTSNQATGTFILAPQEAGAYTYTLAATNAEGKSAYQSVTLTVNDDIWLKVLIGLVIVAVIALVLVFFLTRRRQVPVPISVEGGAGTEVGGGTGAGGEFTELEREGKKGELTVVGKVFLVHPDNTETPLRLGWVGREMFERVLPRDNSLLISREHLQVTQEAGNYYIEDMKSTNGTRLNGEDIKGKGRRQLRNGDEINFGEQITVKVKIKQ